MKLGRSSLFAVVVLASLTGCAATASPVAASHPAPSPVQLTAAELHESDDAPKVGKSQHSDESVLDDEEGKHEVFSHGGLDRKRGGFSGYK